MLPQEAKPCKLKKLIKKLTKKADLTERKPMKYWLVLWCGEGTGRARCMARTADLDLVRTIVKGLHANSQHEDDEDDHVFDAEFVRSAPAVIDDLTRRIRQAAASGWVGEVKEENGNEENGAVSKDQTQESNYERTTQRQSEAS